MKLPDARLCLDCDEVYGEPPCPACGSETFAFLARWVDPAGSRPAAAQPRPPQDAERLEAVRALTRSGLADQRPDRRRHRWMSARRLIGLTTLGLASWAWLSYRKQPHQPRQDAESDEPVSPAPGAEDQGPDGPA